MNIQELKTEEINSLIIELQNELTIRIQHEKETFLNEIRKKADSFGVSVEDLITEAGKPQRRKNKAKPKYKNPDNELETWTGKGRKPSWIVHHLESGKQLANMIID
jgi:DNA-binding protein H-NS